MALIVRGIPWFEKSYFLCNHVAHVIMIVNVYVWMLWQTQAFGVHVMERWFTAHPDNPIIPSLLFTTFR